MRVLVGTLFMLLTAGCRSTPTGPYAPPAEVERDTTKAERLSRLAADLMDADMGRAEELLREALTLGTPERRRGSPRAGSPSG